METVGKRSEALECGEASESKGPKRTKKGRRRVPRKLAYWAGSGGWTGRQGAGLRGPVWGVFWGGSGFCLRLSGCGVTSQLGYPAKDMAGGGGNTR